MLCCYNKITNILSSFILPPHLFYACSNICILFDNWIKNENELKYIKFQTRLKIMKLKMRIEQFKNLSPMDLHLKINSNVVGLL